jgi:streptogramin lyase
VQHRNGVSAIQFAVPDNMVFDGEGNLWVAQDGSGNHLLVFGPGHTTLSPDVRVFTTAVRGSEPTGMTFSPDFRFLFMSFQHPSYNNYVPSMDASGASYRFNRDATFVFSLAADLGNPQSSLASNLEDKYAIHVYPNPSNDWIWVQIPENWVGEKQIQLTDLLGRKLLEVDANASAPTAIDMQQVPIGNYLLTVKGNDGLVGRLITKR